MSSPLWTTIIRTTGKRNNTLKEAILSVATQTYRPVSVIVVLSPAHETDSKAVRKLVRSLRSDVSIHTVTAEPGKKRGHAINVGLDRCESEFVSILDDDDCYSANMGTVLIEALEKGTKNLAYGNTTISRRTPIEEGFEEISRQEHAYGEKFNPVRLVAQNYLHMSSIIYRFSDFKDIRTNEDLDLWEDWCLLLRLLFTQKLHPAYVDETVSEYRIVGNENSNSFHNFSTMDLLSNYNLIAREFKSKSFPVSYEQVFHTYPKLSLIAERPNSSDIQRLLNRIDYQNELLNRKAVKLYLTLCRMLGKLPPQQ